MKITLDLETGLAHQAEAIAARHGMPMKAWIEQSLEYEILDQGSHGHEGRGFTVDEDGMPNLNPSGGAKISETDVRRMMGSLGV